MKKVNEILEIFRKHFKFILLYTLTVTFVSFVFTTELLINKKVSFSGYCALGSFIALVALIDGLAKREFNDGFELGKLDTEVFWKDRYTVLSEKIQDDGFILPMRINESYKILSVEKTGERKFYYSIWEITGIYNKMFFGKRFVRFDDETLLGVIDTLKTTSCPDDISDIDERDKLYYA